MARMDPRYVCQMCGAIHAKWAGRCDVCGAWNTLVEEAARRLVRRGLSEGRRPLMARPRLLLLVEQNAYAALAIADRGYVIESGRIVLSDRGSALLDDEQVKAAYLGV